MTVALALPTLQLSDDELQVHGKLRAQLTNHRQRNRQKIARYEGKYLARNLDIAVPPNLADISVHVDFAETVVNVLAERIEWDGWVSTGDLQQLAADYIANSLDVEQSQVTVDALIVGIGFIAVGTGADGEPDVLITGESPNTCTALWDSRGRRSSSALSQSYDGRALNAESLYLPNQTVKIRYKTTGEIAEIDRDEHNLGRVPVVRFVNQERASDVWGRSEITPPIRYYCDAAARTLLGMEINREFYTAPQRYGLGVDPEQFGISQESPRSERVRRGWEISMARMNFLPYDDENGVMPQVGQFTPAPPTPYIDQVKSYAQRIASAAGIPHTYMGFTTDNPPSGDSIRMLESRLTRRARYRQRMFGRSWREVARLAMMMRDPAIDEDNFAKLSVNWLDPSTPTPAADADRATKLVGQQILPPDSAVTYREAGISETEQLQLEVDKRRATVRSAVDRITVRPPAGAGVTPPARAEGENGDGLTE
ncbi:portal protein [Gordonia phage Angelique]|nr:portal protein [Gordonia phage Angelique]